MYQRMYKLSILNNCFIDFKDVIGNDTIVVNRTKGTVLLFKFASRTFFVLSFLNQYL